MRVYLPWLGEFGSELLKWVTRINADKQRKIVCFEKGKEVLYVRGNVEDFYVVDRIAEAERKCSGALWQENIWAEIIAYYGTDNEYIKPSTTWWSTNYLQNKPFVPTVSDDYKIECDIAVFPRWRHNTARKNWEQWPDFVDMLKAEGFNVFACGHPDSSYKVDCEFAWDYHNSLAASIGAIKNSNVRIGCNTALNILSLYCGMPVWVIISEKGMSCNVGKDGVNYAYYWFADHKDVGWKVFPFYNEPERIIPFICENIES